MRMFVGLDVHKKYTELAIIDEEGVIEKQERIENERGRIEEFSNGDFSSLTIAGNDGAYGALNTLDLHHPVLENVPELLNVRR
jgi:hypothetical protein